MRLALIGDHPDGRAFAVAAIAAGHVLHAYCGDDAGNLEVPFGRIATAADPEDVLVDPQVEAVIVAVDVEHRLNLARRVLQSERHAVVTHPVDITPDGAYELNMLQGDTHQVLLPLLPEAFVDWKLPPGHWCELTVIDPLEPLLYIDAKCTHPAFPGWTLLRRVAGEILEISAFGINDYQQRSGVILCSGRGELGLFHMRCQRGGDRRQLSLQIINDQRETSHDVSDMSAYWKSAVSELDQAVAQLLKSQRADPAAGPAIRPNARLSWRDEIRALELNDATARSLAKRRSIVMEYQEGSEEVGFKGAMTLIGCGMLWLIVMLLILSAWQPWLGWLILPALVMFLGLQMLGMFARRR